MAPSCPAAASTSPPVGATSFASHLEFAREAERGLSDAYLLADGLTVSFGGALLDELAISLQRAGLALNPALILLLGPGEASRVFEILRATLFLVLFATTGGVKKVDRKLMEMAPTFGAGPLTAFRGVALPAALPSIFVGLRLSATAVLTLLIAAEMIGANQGLEFQVMNAQCYFEVPQMFAAILLHAALELLADASLVALRGRLCRWAGSAR